MTRYILAILFIFISVSCSSKLTKQNKSPNTFDLVVDGRVLTPREELNGVISNSILNVRKFSAENGWDHLNEKSVIARAEVVFDRSQMEQRLIEIFNVPKDTPMPKGLTAANNSKDLLLIMPEKESEKYSKKFIEDGFYEKLITHELAHILHVQILNGDESKMGPIWFYEGFPVVVAKQLESFNWAPTKKEALNVMENPQRSDYRQYGWLVRQLRKRNDMKTIIMKASDSDFNKWAIDQIFDSRKK